MDRYVDCDVCEERYWDDDIESHMKEIDDPKSEISLMVCRGHSEEEIWGPLRG